MLKMKLVPVAAVVASALMATNGSASDTPDAGVAKTGPSTPDSGAMNLDLASEANTAAARDAIEAVLNANRLHLDIRLNGRTSGRASEEQLNGR